MEELFFCFYAVRFYLEKHSYNNNDIHVPRYAFYSRLFNFSENNSFNVIFLMFSKI